MSKKPFDAGDEEQVQRQKDMQNLMGDEAATRFLSLLDQYNFRAFLWDLLARTNAMHTPFKEDPHSHAFETGRNSVGREYLNEVLTSRPEAFKIMQREAVGRDLKGPNK